MQHNPDMKFDVARQCSVEVQLNDDVIFDSSDFFLRFLKNKEISFFRFVADHAATITFILNRLIRRHRHLLALFFHPTTNLVAWLEKEAQQRHRGRDQHVVRRTENILPRLTSASPTDIQKIGRCRLAEPWNPQWRQQQQLIYRMIPMPRILPPCSST